jgi:uncharacterized OB-fold protein
MTDTSTFKIEYPYTRTTGPVIGAFLTGVRDGRLLASRIGGRVICPPLEYDPDTGAAVETDLVEVGPSGTVASWTWVAEPTPKHPFDHPFAFAQILLDGADTTIVHAVDAGSPERITTGDRVTAQYRDERVGAITDVYFVPEADAVAQDIEAGSEPVDITTHLISLTVTDELHPARKRFVEGLRRGELVGQRSPASGKVYVPSKGYDALERVRMDESDDVVVPDRGTVTSFTELAPIDYYGQTETKPFIRASILLDGTDQALTGIDIRDIPTSEMRVGMRLQAVWKPEAERTYDVDNRSAGWDGVIERWEPTGEPDMDPRPLQEYVF